MKKVLFVLNNMNIGGTEKSFLNLIDTLPVDKYDITLMLMEKTGGYMEMVPQNVHIIEMQNYCEMKSEIMDPPLTVIRNYLKRGRVKRALALAYSHLLFKCSGDRTLYYKKVLKGTNINDEYDVAVAYCGPFDFVTVFVLFFTKAKRKVQWIHFDVEKFHFNTKMCRKLYPNFEKIYVVSDEAKQALIRKIPGIENITETRLNVVSRENCRRLAEQGNGYTDKYEGIRIITVGRLSKEKGQDIIPIVARKLVDANVDFRWYLIGDGNLRSTILELCKQYSVQDRVVLLGTQINPYQYLRDSDLYIQTSLHEGFCITLAEAKAFDLPIISTECAGAHEQLDGLHNCYVVPRNSDKLYENILETLKMEA